MSMRLLLTASLLLALAARPATAAFEDLGAGARAPGMGDAFTPLADDAYAVHYNPAGLAQLEQAEFSAAYARLFMGLSDGTNLGLTQLAYAQPLKHGRQGTLGFGFERFSASSFYYEQSLAVSYGRQIWKREDGGRLLGGLTIKQLSHGFGTPAEAACPIDPNTGTCNPANGPDPVLSGKTSKSADSVDIGFLYRFPRRLQLGLAVMNFNEPNVGFSGSDKVARSVRMGAAWKSLWMTLTGELRQEQAPTGATDRQLVFGGERVFPTLTAGQFSLRGSLGYGTRDFEQLTLGLGYRINKIQIDYAFLMPLGTVQGTAGTHRVSLGWRFGAPAPEDQITQELLEQAKRMREGRMSYGYEYAAELRPQSLDDPRLAEVRRLIEGRLYRRAHETLAQFILAQLPDEPLMRLSNRLELVSHYYPDWAGPRARWENIVVSSIWDFLHGHDRKAILKASYALSLARNDSMLDHFLTDMESAVGIKAERLSPENPRGMVDEMLVRVEAANARHETQTVNQTLQDILDLDPENAMATEKAGSMYYILGRYQEAVDVWTLALNMESNPAEVQNLQRHISLARERLGGKAAVLAPAPSQPSTAAPAPQPAAPAAAQPQAMIPVSQPQPVAPAMAPQPVMPAAPIAQPAVTIPVIPAPVDQPAAAIPVVPAPAVQPAATIPVVPAAPAAAAAQPQPQPAPAAQPQARPSASGDVERLFQKGVEHYARGEYLQATAMFLRILQIDPDNAQARKALERLQYRPAANQ